MSVVPQVNSTIVISGICVNAGKHLREGLHWRSMPQPEDSRWKLRLTNT